MRSFVALFAVAILLVIPIAVGVAVDCVTTTARPQQHLVPASAPDCIAVPLILGTAAHFRAPPATR